MTKRICVAPLKLLEEYDLSSTITYDCNFRGFDYQEVLLRYIFNDHGSNIDCSIVTYEFQKSVGFDIDKIYPEDSPGEGEKYWLLQHFVTHPYWKIEYNKFIETLPQYKQVFYNFNIFDLDSLHINENWNNWLQS